MTSIPSPFESAIPLYRQVAEKLYKAIMDGTFQPGTALPSEGQLCETYGVSRITVRKALDELAGLNVVVRRQGVGTFVSDTSRSSWSVTLTGVIEDVLSPTNMTIIREDTVTPPPDVLEFVNLPPWTKLKLFEGTNYIADGSPLVHVSYYFPQSVAEKLSSEALTGRAQAIKLIEQTLNLRVDHASQVVLPMIAVERIADYLQVPAGTAVLRAIRAYYDAKQQPIEIFDAAYHPQNYRYTAHLYPRARKRG